ncbi:MAG: flagellar hook-length control protein FliK [Sphingomonas sp.]
MIDTSFALLPTAPGSSAKGASAVVGELFASSMLAASAVPDPAAAPGNVAGAADPARQALAAPGITVPTAPEATVDPALAWLPAVNIDVPAPLDVPAGDAVTPELRRDAIVVPTGIVGRRPAPTAGTATVAPTTDAVVTPNDATTTLAHDPATAPTGATPRANPARTGATARAQPEKNAPVVRQSRRPDSAASAVDDGAEQKIEETDPHREPTLPSAPSLDLGAVTPPAEAVQPAADHGMKPSDSRPAAKPENAPPSQTASGTSPVAVAVAAAPAQGSPSSSAAVAVKQPPARDTVAPTGKGVATGATAPTTADQRPIRYINDAHGADASTDAVAKVVTTPVAPPSVSPSDMPAPAKAIAPDATGAAAPPEPQRSIAPTPSRSQRGAPKASEQPPVAARDDTSALPEDTATVPATSDDAETVVRTETIEPQLAPPEQAAVPVAPATIVPAALPDATVPQNQTASAPAQRTVPRASAPVASTPPLVQRAAAQHRPNAATDVNEPAAERPAPTADAVAMQATPATPLAAPEATPSVQPVQTVATAAPAPTPVATDGAAPRARPLGRRDPLPPSVASDSSNRTPGTADARPIVGDRDDIAPAGPKPRADAPANNDTATVQVGADAAPAVAQATAAPALAAAIAPPRSSAPAGRTTRAADATGATTTASVAPSTPATPAPRTAATSDSGAAATIQPQPAQAPSPASRAADVRATPASQPTATPVIAVAAPVAVAGAAVAPTAIAAVDAPVAAEPLQRAVFAREVSAPTRQTVALRPRAEAPLQPAAGLTAPASQVFGAAMHAAGADERRTASASEPVIETPTITVAAPVETRPATPVADAAQPVLDMREQAWPGTMIDHIERLRDAANANDTRIRLVPDALGAIDVAVKTVGGALHVRFAADDASTRAMLDEARPKLAAIAEERGLTIATSVVEPSAAAQAQGQTQGQTQGQPQAQTGAQQPSSGGQNASAGAQQQGQAQPQSQSGQQQRPPQSTNARQPDRPARGSSRDTDAADGRVA